MRFAELSLERYGRFDGCRLRFRPGQPDLHIIYGANEAGKSTTVEAVSDLLFGFPVRSSFNFRFDYPLLRVGAVLEEDGRRLACRRRKAQSQTLVDADDRPIDEGPLLSMLRGWTRDRFRLGFSLDQTRLREGGRAIVDAKDDLGQALFAAGSGMTGIVTALAALETEAEAVWGRRASGKRLYTAAERQFEEGQKLVRERLLRPKAWSDAQALARRQAEELVTLQTRRVELAGERRRFERLRRIGPDVRQRADLLAEIQHGSPVVLLSSQVESAAEAALASLDAAGRSRQAAETLMGELDRRAAALQLDGAVLQVEADIQALFLRRGAVQKGLADLPGLRAELDEKRGREASLREEIGSQAPLVPRVAIGRLRDMVGRRAKNLAGVAEIEISIARARRRAAWLREELGGVAIQKDLPALAVAVDAALALGTDIDARCAVAARKFDRSDQAARAALARLRPWSGTAEALRGLPVIAASEIDATEEALRRATEGLETERLVVAAIDEELRSLAVERGALAESGDAVPAARVAEARAARDELWKPLRAHVVSEQPLDDPAAAAFDYQIAVSKVDTLADHRFQRAEASGRLAGLDARADTLAKTRKLAVEQMQRWETEEAAAQLAWKKRLDPVGLPVFSPSGVRGWLDGRRSALDDLDAADSAHAEMEAILQSRSTVRGRLWDVLRLTGVTDSSVPEHETLGWMLDRATLLRADWEAARAREDELKAELASLDEQIADAAARLDAAEQRRGALVEEWNAECRDLGLELAIDGADVRLAFLDELRGLAEATETLERRVHGIERDARTFGEDVSILLARLGEASSQDAGAALDAMQSRLKKARDGEIVSAEIAASARARDEEIQAANAVTEAALASLAPVLTQLGVTNVADVGPKVEASRVARRRAEEVAHLERRIAEAGDGYPLVDLVSAFEAEDPDTLARRVDGLDANLSALDATITEAAGAAGAAREAAELLESGAGASEVAADAEMARAEMDAQAEV